MTSRQYILLAAAGSAALLLGAFTFQALGYAPCAICLWQRWPHAAAVAIGVIAYGLNMRGLAWLGALAALTTGGIGVYHTGIERGWWNGPESCTSSGDGFGDLSASALLPGADVAPVVLCDEVVWELLGLSMASWNASASFALALVWIYGATSRD